MVVAATAFVRPWPLLVLLWALPVAGAADLQPFRADFQYDGELHLEGDIDAHCRAWGARIGSWPADGLVFAAGNARLVIRRTYSNVTFAGGQDVQAATELQQSTVDLPPGTFRLVPNEDAGAALYPEGTSSAASGHEPSFDVHTRATSVALAPLQSRPPLGFDHWTPRGSLPPTMDGARFLGGRPLQQEGPAFVHGNASIYLRGVALHAPDGFTTDLGRYRVAETLEAMPGSGVRRERFLDAFLDVQNARMDLPPGSRSVCEGFEARVAGGLSAANVHGWARRGPDIHDLDGRVLSATGQFDLREQSRLDGPEGRESFGIHSVADGHAAAWGIDYVAVPSPSALPLLPAGLGLAAAVLASALAAKHAGTLVGLLYARLGPDRVLDHPRRSQIFAQIQERPGLDLSQLAHELGCPLNSLIYHVRVLKRTGKVGIVRQGKSLRVLVREAMPVRPTLLPNALLAWDEPLRATTELLAAGPQPLSDVTAALSVRLGLSRRGALHAIDRGVRRGVLVKEASPRGTRGRGTIVRCA